MSAQKMIKMLAAFGFCLALISANNAMAEVRSVKGKITRILTFSKSYDTYTESSPGLTAIYVEGLPQGCGTGTGGRVVIGVNHPVYQTALSIALTAFTTGKSVSLHYLDTCKQRAGSWDFAYILVE